MPRGRNGCGAARSPIIRGRLPAFFLCFATAIQAQEPPRPTPVAPGKALPSPHLPTRFTAYVGGGIFPPNYTVELRGGSLVYHVQEMDSQTNAVQERSKVITPSAEQWRRFWKVMDEVGLWGWQAEYPNPLVADGLKWDLDITLAGRWIASSGSNAFPDKPGPSRKLPPSIETAPSEPSKRFAAYLAAVEELLGGEPFR